MFVGFSDSAIMNGDKAHRGTTCSLAMQRKAACGSAPARMPSNSKGGERETVRNGAGCCSGAMARSPSGRERRQGCGRATSETALVFGRRVAGITARPHDHLWARGASSGEAGRATTRGGGTRRGVGKKHRPGDDQPVQQRPQCDIGHPANHHEFGDQRDARPFRKQVRLGAQVSATIARPVASTASAW